MKLLTKVILKAFEKQGDTSEKDAEDIKVIVKFFGGATRRWYATDYDPERRMFFGFVSLFNDYNDELGYFSLDELEGIKFPPFGLGIERDTSLMPGDYTLKQIMDGARP